MGQGRDTFLVWLGRQFQRFPLAWLRLLEAPFTYSLGRKSRRPYMIFLVALPRSGSTLSYQVMVHSLRSHYLSNLGNLLYQLPLLGGLLAAYLCRGYRSNFRSSEGFVPGLCGPAEGLQYWAYWLGYQLDERQPSKVDDTSWQRRSVYIRRVFSLLSTSRKPIITGFLGHSLEPQRIQQAFPQAIFVRLHRDTLSTALSLLRCRRSMGEKWFSLFPAECSAHLGEGEYAEVAAQVYWVNRRLDDRLRGTNVFHLDYEEVCRDPQGQMDALIDFCNARGFELSKTAELPRRFEQHWTGTQLDTDGEMLRRAIKRLEDEYGALQPSRVGVR